LNLRNLELFYVDSLPSERRLTPRDGIQSLGIHYWDNWDNALSVVAGCDECPHLLRYDPHDLSKILVEGVSSEGSLAIPYPELAHPPITLVERRAALRDLAKHKQRALTENAMFATVAAQRLLIERAQRKTLTARRRAQQRPKSVALK
jgi:putative transposase